MSTNSPDRSWLRDPWVWGLLAAGGLLLLWNLGSSGRLWQDEAETAILAKNVLHFGYPKVFDGLNRVNPGLTAGLGGSWAYHPWLQFYVTAAAFWLLGPTTVAARLPFALLGVASVLLTYHLALLLVQHRAVARLTALLTLLSVPLLLHFRQCRYYAPAVVATLWVLIAYHRAREGKRGSWWWLAGGLLVLFNSHHGAFLPTVAALVLDTWRRGIPANARKPLLIVGLAVVGLTLPWFLVLNLTQHQGTFSPKEFAHHTQFYLRQINRYLVPMVFFLLAWAGRGLRPLIWWRAATGAQRNAVQLVLLVLVCNVVFITTIPWQRHFRYLIHLVPLMYLLEAVLLWSWLRSRRLALVIVTGLLLTTDLLHYSAPYLIVQAIPRFRDNVERIHGLVTPQPLLAKYLYELTHQYRGPVDGLIETLQRMAKPGDTLKIPYDDHAVIFYTGLKVEDLNHFTAETSPDWIVPRRDWVPAEFYTSLYYQQIQQSYDRIETDAPDLIWQNRPDPGAHVFRTNTKAPRLILYHRRASP